jgi:hypothetical protein
LPIITSRKRNALFDVEQTPAGVPRGTVNRPRDPPDGGAAAEQTSGDV